MWKMLSVPFQKIPEVQKINPIFQDALSEYIKGSSHKRPKINLGILTMLVVVAYKLVLNTEKIPGRKWRSDYLSVSFYCRLILRRASILCR